MTKRQRRDKRNRRHYLYEKLNYLLNNTSYIDDNHRFESKLRSVRMDIKYIHQWGILDDDEVYRISSDLNELMHYIKSMIMEE